uniref:Uncharacterized protein n=1 Tax=Falco tinnunculus TaxID=100819 RepID=A0A8C4UJ23_FALTI
MPPDGRAFGCHLMTMPWPPRCHWVPSHDHATKCCPHPVAGLGTPVVTLTLVASPGTGFMACHLSQLLRSSYIFLFQLPWLPELLLSLADFELVRTALTGSWLGIQNAAQQLTEQEVDAYLYGLSQPGGLTPPLNYYRNLFRDTPIPREPPPLPTLLLWGAEDAFLDARLVPCLRRCLRPTARLCLLPGAGHWLPEDQPRPVARLLDHFLGTGDHHH